MSENTLYDAIKNLELQYQLTQYQQKSCERFFSFIKPGDLIYAGQLKSKLAIDIDKSYEILEELRKQGFLVLLYEVYCTTCSKSKGIFLTSLSEFDSEYHCDFCDTHLNPMDHLVVLYKVIKK